MERNQSRGTAAAVGLVGAPTRIDPQVATDGPTRLLQPLQKRSVTGLPFRIIRRQMHENADPPQPVWLLRPRRERPRGPCAAKQREELAALHSRNHSITCSARAISIGGTVRPSALAALRLMNRSNLVGCWTGNSAGLAPLRIRPA